MLKRAGHNLWPAASAQSHLHESDLKCRSGPLGPHHPLPSWSCSSIWAGWLAGRPAGRPGPPFSVPGPGLTLTATVEPQEPCDVRVTAEGLVPRPTETHERRVAAGVRHIGHPSACVWCLALSVARPPCLLACVHRPPVPGGEIPQI